MGVRLIVEVLDHWQDVELTAGERGDLIVVAENANDQTRETYGSIHQPYILARAGKSAAGWKNALGKLMRKKALEYAVDNGRELSGFPGRHAVYRIAVLCPEPPHDGHTGQCTRPDWVTPQVTQSAKAGHLRGDPMTDDSPGTGHPSGGNGSPDRWERVTPQVTPTPLTPLTPQKKPGPGRRPATGSRGERASGYAAPDEIGSQVSIRDLGRVIAALPPALVQALEAHCPGGLPADVPDAVRAELRCGLTVEQLVTRINDRWSLRGFALDADTEYGGRGLQRPVGVAIALVRRGGCTHPRCNDGTDLDTGEPCRTCERTREDRIAAAAQTRPALRQVTTDGVRDPVPAGGGVPGQQPLLVALTNPEPAPAPRVAPPAPQEAPDDSEAPYGHCVGCNRPMARQAPMCQRCIREQRVQAGAS